MSLKLYRDHLEVLYFSHRLFFFTNENLFLKEVIMYLLMHNASLLLHGEILSFLYVYIILTFITIYLKAYKSNIRRFPFWGSIRRTIMIYAGLFSILLNWYIFNCFGAMLRMYCWAGVGISGYKEKYTFSLYFLEELPNTSRNV